MRMTREQAQRIVSRAKDELLERRIVALDGSGHSAVESLLLLAGIAARGELEITDKQPPKLGTITGRLGLRIPHDLPTKFVRQ